MQNVRNLPDGLIHKGIHLFFAQIGIFPVQMILALKIEIRNVLSAVIESILAEFLHK